MSDAFELLDPEDAQAFLMRFPALTQRKGQSLFRSGRVEIVPEEPGTAYSSLVQDGEELEVDLHYGPAEGWDGDCSCPRERNCEHVFAAMSALLAEHRMTAVRRLSAGLAPTPKWAAARAKGATAGSGELARRLMAATGRGLTREESKFLQQIHTVYERSRQQRQVTFWDFETMGLGLKRGYGSLQIWPAPPQSEHEFWLFVAQAVQDDGGTIPDFMAPVTDLASIQEPLARWRRSLEIEKWSQALTNFQSVAPTTTGAPEPTDLRLKIYPDEALLEWQRPGQSSFERVKNNQFRQLAAGYEDSGVWLTAEGELLWQFFSHLVAYGRRLNWEYMDQEALQLLSRILRVPLLESRIVTEQGLPLARPSERLRWELVPAAAEEDDYRLRLVQANGAPTSAFLCVLPGRPTLYLTPNAVLAGPEVPRYILDPEEETRIPAPAIERAVGVTFLQSLGLELPPRVRERLRPLAYQVEITCALRPSLARSDAEDCIFQVLAHAPDGHQQIWTGYNWLQQTARKPAKRSEDKETIVFYDSSALAPVPALFESLNLKPSGGELILRVTRKFPEVFALWLQRVPPNVTVKLEGELASFNQADVAGRLKLEVTEAEIDWFDLRVVLDLADTTLTAAELKMLLNARGGYVRLEGKGWRRLHYDLGEEENEKLARLGVSARELSDEPQRLHALQLADEAAKKFLPEAQVQQLQRRAGEIKARVAPPLPAGVTAQLRPYQLEGFHFLAYLATNRFGGILADDMGLGKTLQTLAWLLWLREQPAPRGRSLVAQAADQPGQEPAPAQGPAAGAPPSLVICPKSVMDNWRAEAARFTPALRVRVWSPRELPNFSNELAGADLHVLNYSQLRSLGENLKAVRWLTVILDEGQYIKNPGSQTAQVARALHAEHRLILSGTPIENRLLDLWSLMAFAMPGVLGQRAQFARGYDSKGDPFARRRLAARVRPFVLRRTKAQVAQDLPDRVEEELFCEIEGEQETLYRAELKRAQQLLLGIKSQKQLAQQQFHFLTSLLRLRQICCDPRLLQPDAKEPGAKAEALMEQLEPLMEEGQKVLVFSQFVSMLELLRPALTARHWPLFYLAGDTENRGELVRKFQAAEGAAVFLISLKAGGFGLNLTAASYVVLFDPWWNPAVESQAIDRTHRIGQSNKVIAYRLLIKNSIEEKIRALQKQKKALAEDVLGEEKFAQSLTLEDLQFLFAD